jgi:WD40 repeat protein
VLLWDTRLLLAPTRWLEGHDGLMHCLAFSPDGKRLVTGDAEGVVKLWDTRTGLEVLSLPAHDRAVNGVAFSPDGQFLYTTGADRTVKVWDGSSREGRPKAEDKKAEAEDEDQP